MVAGICGGVGASVLTILGQWTSARADPLRDLPYLTPDQLEAWRSSLRLSILRARIAEGSQLDQMLGQGALIPTHVEELGATQRDSGRPWARVVEEWSRDPSRMVILGEPGSGKTVAALSLIAHVNSEQREHKPVVELFPLVAWDAWRRGSPDASFAEWLSAELASTYPEFALGIARNLIEAGLVIPVLDGLDEIPSVEGRHACKEAIDRFARRSPPHGQFVVTCRTDVYLELHPHWVSTDRPPLVLRPLEPEEILAALNTSPWAHERWDAAREAIGRGDPALTGVLGSPLRLSIALQVYGERDPDELIHQEPGDAEGRLWELLLESRDAAYEGHEPDQVRRWLSFLARAMKSGSRLRFALHELPLLTPASDKEVRRFIVTVTASVSLASALYFGVSAALTSSGAPIVTIVFGCFLGAFAGFLGGTLAAGLPAQVTLPSTPRTRSRLLTRGAVAAAALAGFSVGQVLGPPDLFSWGVAVAGVGGALGGVAVLGLVARLLPGTQVVADDPPSWFAASSPTAVLRASRNAGLRAAVVWAPLATVFMMFATVTTSAGESNLTGADLLNPSSLTFLSGFGLLAGLVAASLLGAGPWLFNAWLRRRRAREGILPRRLPRFLAWCAEPERGWLRIGDAYEFRHRSLLDHLSR